MRALARWVQDLLRELAQLEPGLQVQAQQVVGQLAQAMQVLDQWAPERLAVDRPVRVLPGPDLPQAQGWPVPVLQVLDRRELVLLELVPDLPQAQGWPALVLQGLDRQEQVLLELVPVLVRSLPAYPYPRA